MSLDQGGTNGSTSLPVNTNTSEGGHMVSVGPKLNCKNEDVAPETGLSGNFEDIGRAFVQAYKEGWRLYKQPKNETRASERAMKAMQKIGASAV